MRAKYNGNKPDRIIMNIYNAEVSAAIPLGYPVIFSLSSTAVAGHDGMDVVLPATATSASYQLGSGVNCTPLLAVKNYGEAIMYGYCENTAVVLRTRANSTTTWASVASIASAVLLVPDFTNNGWATLANVVAQSGPNVILVDNIATLASAASAIGGTALVSTGLYRSFVHML
jgi:hypothetical protein